MSRIRFNSTYMFSTWDGVEEVLHTTDQTKLVLKNVNITPERYNILRENCNKLSCLSLLGVNASDFDKIAQIISESRTLETFFVTSRYDNITARHLTVFYPIARSRTIKNFGFDVSKGERLTSSETSHLKQIIENKEDLNLLYIPSIQSFSNNLDYLSFIESDKIISFYAEDDMYKNISEQHLANLMDNFALRSNLEAFIPPDLPSTNNLFHLMPRYILNIISSNRDLITLDIKSYNYLGMENEIIDAMFACRSLENLIIGKINCNEVFYDNLQEFLLANNNLITFTINFAPLSFLEKLPNIVKENQNIVLLSISSSPDINHDVALSSRFNKIIIDLIDQDNGLLDLNTSNISSRATNSSQLLEAIKNSHTLRSLVLDICDTSDAEFIELLAETIQVNSSIQTLHIKISDNINTNIGKIFQAAEYNNNIINFEFEPALYAEKHFYDLLKNTKNIKIINFPIYFDDIELTTDDIKLELANLIVNLSHNYSIIEIKGLNNDEISNKNRKEYKPYLDLISKFLNRNNSIQNILKAKFYEFIESSDAVYEESENLTHLDELAYAINKINPRIILFEEYEILELTSEQREILERQIDILENRFKIKILEQAGDLRYLEEHGIEQLNDISQVLFSDPTSKTYRDAVRAERGATVESDILDDRNSYVSEYSAESLLAHQYYTNNEMDPYELDSTFWLGLFDELIQ